MTDISICFGTAHRLEMLKNCVASIRQAVGSLSYEMMITDGGSNDGSLEYMREQPDIFVIEHGELRGAVAAYSDAVRAAHGDYVCYLSDDLVLTPNMISDAVDYLRKHPKCGVVSLPYRNGNGNIVRMNRATIGDKAYPFASFGVLRRADGDLVDWFPNTIYHYYLDSTICMRIAKLGLTIDELPGKHVITHYEADNITRGERKSSTYSIKQDNAGFVEFAKELLND